MSNVKQRYQNMKAELLRVGVTQEQVANHLGMTPNNLNAKLNGHVPFTVNEVKEIQHAFTPDATFDYLLETVPAMT